MKDAWKKMKTVAYWATRGVSSLMMVGFAHSAVKLGLEGSTGASIVSVVMVWICACMAFGLFNGKVPDDGEE